MIIICITVNGFIIHMSVYLCMVWMGETCFGFLYNTTTIFHLSKIKNIAKWCWKKHRNSLCNSVIKILAKVRSALIITCIK